MSPVPFELGHVGLFLRTVAEVEWEEGWAPGRPGSRLCPASCETELIPPTPSPGRKSQRGPVPGPASHHPVAGLLPPLGQELCQSGCQRAPLLSLCVRSQGTWQAQQAQSALNHGRLPVGTGTCPGALVVQPAQVSILGGWAEGGSWPQNPRLPVSPGSGTPTSQKSVVPGPPPLTSCNRAARGVSALPALLPHLKV